MSIGSEITSLLLNQGNIAAQRAQQQGQITAQTIGGITQALSGIPAQMQAAKAADQQSQLRDLQLKAAKREEKSVAAYQTALSDPNNLKDDGTVDDAKVGAYLQKNDVGAYDKWSALSAARSKASLEASKTIAEINASTVSTQEKQAALQKTKQDYLGRLAYSGLNMLAEKPDDPLHARDTFLATVAHAASPTLPGVPPAIDGKTAQDLIMRTAGADRSQLAQMFTSVIPPELKAKLDKEQADTAKTNADAAKARVEAANLEKYGAVTPPTAQMDKWRVNGVGDVPLQFVPGKKPEDSGHYYLTQPNGVQKELFPGKDFTAIPPAAVTIHNAATTGGPGDYTKTGEDFLSSIPVQWRTTVKKLANYEEDPTKVASMRGGMREQLMQWVNQVNPGYDQAQFTDRSPMRRAFTSGAQGQTINSLNTAIGHLDQFTNVIKALDNGNFRPGNEAYNWMKATFGDSAPTNFDGIRSIMSGELASAFKKSGATDQEIASVEHAVQSKNSTKQLMDYVTTIALPALGSKVVNFDQQYRQVMGPNDPLKILLPESVDILKKHGINPEHPSIGGNQNAQGNTAAGGFSVKAPDGKTYTFPSQSALDNFKKAAGL